MAPTLYYVAMSPPCRAVRVAAWALEIDIIEKDIDMLKGENRSEEFLKISPNHTIPVLLDDENFTLFESRAIILYLVNKYRPDTPLYPTEPRKRAKVDEALYFDVALFATLKTALAGKYFKGEVSPEDADNFREKVQVLEKLVGKKPFIAGDFLSLADITIGVLFPTFHWIAHDLLSPALAAYRDRVYAACPHLKTANEPCEGVPYPTNPKLMATKE